MSQLPTRPLGRTGLEPTILGLGCGGPSRLGLNLGRADEEALAVLRAGMEQGITFIDTAENYGNEALVAQALADTGTARDDIVISTKKTPELGGNGRLLEARELIEGVEASLRRLNTDRIDIFHLHGVRPGHYRRALDRLRPALEQLREQGKIRFLGITERFEADTGHRMLDLALADDLWQVVMVGFNVLNQTARERVFPATQSRGIGTLVMFAVRRALSRPDRLREVVADLIKVGHLSPELIDPERPLDWLLEVEGIRSIPDAAYRFCRDEAGCDVILFGTSTPEHVKANIDSMLAPPLPDWVRERLVRLFEGAASASGS